MIQRKTGTKEWAEVNKNFLKGCQHGCLYCYARSMAERFKRVKDIDEWVKPVVLKDKLFEKPHKVNGRIMFPTTHDILPEHIFETVNYLRDWLAVGNEILIVSKPHFECIKAICDELSEYKSQIVFRFTIGSTHNYVLKFWEPGAPDFTERLTSLKYAFKNGYKTSVSCEPFLDEHIVDLVNLVEPFVTDTIWIGKMNKIKTRVHTKEFTEDGLGFLRRVERCQTDEAIYFLYNALQHRSKIRWKDSIKQVLGLPEGEVG